MKKEFHRLFLAGLMTCFFSASVFAGTVRDVRVWSTKEGTRVVIELDRKHAHKVFAVPESKNKPHRVVVDVSDAQLKSKIKKIPLGGTPIRRIRTGHRNNGDLRLVFDMNDDVQPVSSVLPAKKRHGYRVVVDFGKGQKKARQTKHTPKTRELAYVTDGLKAEPVKPLNGGNNPKRAAVSKPVAVAEPNPPRVLKPQNSIQRQIVIAVDAGHGGADPGAIGKRGTQEKDVTLAISRALVSLINQNRNMKAVMVRDGDHFLPLRKRMAIARKHQADLFVSIHADASFKRKNVTGSTVYTLSEKGAKSEANKWLAQKENSADMVGGLSLDDKDKVLAHVLFDLAQTATNELSLNVAQHVIKSLSKVVDLHKEEVQQANFAVLKSPDIPSILVETAFISTPREERNLRNPSYQLRIAKAIFSGIDSYFDDNPLPGSFLASYKRHTIARGETLSDIAAKYQVGVREIRSANGLRDDQINVGQILEIPVDGS